MCIFNTSLTVKYLKWCQSRGAGHILRLIYKTTLYTQLIHVAVVFTEDRHRNRIFNTMCSIRVQLHS